MTWKRARTTGLPSAPARRAAYGSLLLFGVLGGCATPGATYFGAESPLAVSTPAAASTGRMAGAGSSSGANIAASPSAATQATVDDAVHRHYQLDRQPAADIQVRLVGHLEPADETISLQPPSDAGHLPEPTEPAVEPDLAAVELLAAPACDVDLPSVLQTVAGRNPQVAFASQRYAEAYARLQAAQVLWLPALRAGVSYNKHDGKLQDVQGNIIDVSRNALNPGLGTFATAAGSPAVPGVSFNLRTADAVFQPAIAEQALAARGAAATAVTNDLLLEAALAYLDLLRALQAQAIAQQTLRDVQELAFTTTEFARTGQGSPADADRAATELAIRETDLLRTDEDIQVASARLVQLLSGDPRRPLRPLESTIVAVDLTPAHLPVEDLLPTGLATRPELAESRHLVAEAMERYRREKMAPWLPSVLLGVSYSGFGGGLGGQMQDFGDRFDLDTVVYWEIRGLGAGEQAARAEARARMEQTRYEQVRLMDRVAREIVEAHAQVQIRRKQLPIAEQAVERAVSSVDRHRLRIRDLEGLPIESLQSIQALDQARRQYLRVLVEYNEAQFRLRRALGWPIDCT